MKKWQNYAKENVEKIGNQCKSDLNMYDIFITDLIYNKKTTKINFLLCYKVHKFINFICTKYSDATGLVTAC